MTGPQQPEWSGGPAAVALLRSPREPPVGFLLSLLRLDAPQAAGAESHCWAVGGKGTHISLSKNPTCGGGMVGNRVNIPFNALVC